MKSAPLRLSKDEILARVVSVLHESFELDPSQILPTSHLIDDLDLDSIDAIDMVVALEEETGLHMSEDDLRQLRVVSDVVELVYQQLGSD